MVGWLAGSLSATAVRFRVCHRGYVDLLLRLYFYTKRVDDVWFLPLPRTWWVPDHCVCKRYRERRPA